MGPWGVEDRGKAGAGSAMPNVRGGGWVKGTLISSSVLHALQPLVIRPQA